jgi:predicted HTH transcriptional regulator
MAALVDKAQGQLTRRTFVAVADLCAQLYASLVRILERDGLIASRPFDARSARVPLSSIDERYVAEFVSRASTARNFSFKKETDTHDTLTHLSLVDGQEPCNAAVILFAAEPKRVIQGAFVNCIQFPGLEPVKPALSQNVFSGPLFAQIEDSLNFVMSRLSNPVDARDKSARLDVAPELPKAAVTEALVNALAHRDYTSSAPVQVRLFADRLEVSNPGQLPRSLTPEHLRRTHPSIPANPLLSEVLFLMGYIDRAGTGTLDMLAKCRDAELPEPDFFQDGDHWIVRLWRDALTDAVLNTFPLNYRQIAAITEVKLRGLITNRRYQDLTGASRQTASRELGLLVSLGLLAPTAKTGRGAAYVRCPGKRPRNVPNAASTTPTETPQKRPKRPQAKKQKKSGKPAKKRSS